MTTDREIAARAIDMQNRARDFPLITLPQYNAWIQRKIDEGEPLELLSQLDSQCMWLLPEDVPSVSNDEFEELYSDLKSSLGE